MLEAIKRLVGAIEDLFSDPLARDGMRDIVWKKTKVRTIIEGRLL